jgi:Repeating coiled region of VPS13
MCAGGKAVVVPVLERCEMDATLHLAKSQHPKLPPLRLGVTLPTLRFFISPARLHRVMRILHAALPSALQPVPLGAVVRVCCEPWHCIGRPCHLLCVRAAGGQVTPAHLLHRLWHGE